MKLYIAGQSQAEARSVAKIMREAGHAITSSWLDEDFTKTGEYTDEDRTRIAARDVREVSESDAIIVIPSPRRIPGGKFVEVGVAIGLEIPVEVLGHRENMLMYHPLVSVWNSAEDFIKGKRLIE